LAEFAEELRERRWTADDVHAVEMAVLRVLAGVMETASGNTAHTESA